MEKDGFGYLCGMNRLFQMAFGLLLLPAAMTLMGFAPVQRKGVEVKSLAAALSDTLYPTPPASDKLLFYVQRTPNTNTIVYELNTDKEGKPNQHEPVHVYWIRYQEGGKKAELTYIQRKFAYGLHHALTDPEKHSYKLNFVSYGKKDIHLERSLKDKKYHAYLDLGAKKIEVSRIYIRVEGGSFWFPNVPYIEISGKDATTGHFVKERIKP